MEIEIGGSMLNFFFENRTKTAIYFVVMGAIVTAFLAGIFAVIASARFTIAFVSCYIFFGAPSAVAGAMLILFPKSITLDNVYGMSCGFYYGGCVLAASLVKLGLKQDSLTLSISFIISGLCCIIYILKSKLDRERGKSFEYPDK